jgi:phage gp36-like protein
MKAYSKVGSSNCWVRSIAMAAVGVGVMVGGVVGQWTTTTNPAGIYYNSGNVGIGALTPGEKLEVKNGSIYAHGATPGMGRIVMQLDGANQFEWYPTTVGLELYNRTAQMLPIVFANSGNVGIGASTPSEKLEVKNGSIYAHGATPGMGRIVMQLDGANQFEWYPTAAGLELYNRTAKMLPIVFSNNGNVGIGISTPGAKLDVSGNINATGSISATSNISAAGNAIFNGNVGIGVPTPGEKLEVKNGSIYAHGTTAGMGRIVMQLDGANQFEWYPTAAGLELYNRTAQMLPIVFSNNGNVGIGAATPGEKLEVAGNIKATGNISAAGNASFTGNVGIGTTNPGSYKLAVEGKIGAREVVVTTAAWADHVFKPGYKRMSLSEIDEFIKTNRHLPGIPTEKEVRENGVPVGAMQAKLLEKVEELTLEMIAMKKENDQLRNRVSQMEKSASRK